MSNEQEQLVETVVDQSVEQSDSTKAVDAYHAEFFGEDKQETVEQSQQSIEEPIATSETVEVEVPEESTQTEVDPVEDKVNSIIKQRLDPAIKTLDLRESQLRKKEQEIKLRADKYSKYEKLENMKDENPYAILEAYGITADKIFDNELDRLTGDVDPKKQVDHFEKKYTQELSKRDEKINRLESWIETQQRNDHLRGLEKQVTRNSEKYPILAKKMSDKVKAEMFDLEIKHYSETGDRLQPEQVAEIFENYYTKEAKQLLSELKEMEAFKTYFNEQTVQAAKPEITKSENLQKPASLSNQMTSEPAKGKSEEELSQEERDKKLLESQALDDFMSGI